MVKLLNLVILVLCVIIANCFNVPNHNRLKKWYSWGNDIEVAKKWYDWQNVPSMQHKRQFDEDGFLLE